MRDDEDKRKISEIEQAQADLRDSIAESEQLAARVEALLNGSRRAMSGQSGGQAQA
jgi:hypothetical protein